MLIEEDLGQHPGRCCSLRWNWLLSLSGNLQHYLFYSPISHCLQGHLPLPMLLYSPWSWLLGNALLFLFPTFYL